jgi:tetratricopeptide (TPR) repeat protein
MKKFILVLSCLVVSVSAHSQDTTATSISSLPPEVSQAAKKIMTEKSNAVLSEISNDVCKCIDSVPLQAISKKETAAKIHACIDKQATAYQIGKKMMQIDLDSGAKNLDITIASDPESNEYKQYYYEMERYLMDNCPSMKSKLASNDLQGKNSVSQNPEAIRFYSAGQKADTKENYQEAIKNYLKAVQVDPTFAFAYDNLGVSYRKTGDFGNAIKAYKKSLEINPQGETPLQNLAIVYQQTKEYRKAIDCYEQLAKFDKDNPEVYYGIGQTCAVYIEDFEKALDNLCIAYNLYDAQKSPYRADAEKLINYVNVKMKAKGKEKEFNDILKKHNISPY